MWEYHQGSSAGSYMLFGVGQQYSVGRKTRLIAVLMSGMDHIRRDLIAQRATSWQRNLTEKPSCPKNSLIILLKTKANFSVAKRAAEDLRV